MAHYAHVLTVNRLELMAHIGFYEKERNVKQPIEVSFRLYFPGAIACNHNDAAPFFDYGILAESLKQYVADQKFNLIEYMTICMFEHLRAEVNRMGGADAKLWLHLNKIKAPVPDLKGGASFIHSDLPPDATYIPSIML